MQKRWKGLHILWDSFKSILPMWLWLVVGAILLFVLFTSLSG